MTIEHKDIVDPNIHEPKGISTASGNTVYHSLGTGTGTWKKVDADSIDISDLNVEIQSDLNDATLTVSGRLWLTGVIADISTASGIIFPIPNNCTVVKASVVLGGGITTADASIDFKNSAGATMGSPVVVAYNSSAKGDQYSFTATGNNVLTGPTWIEVTTDGASDTAQPLFVTVEIKTQLN